MAIDQSRAQKRLGEVIRRRRKELGYSQEAFASECGIHRTYMGAVERGERNLSLMNIVRIANNLGIPPSVLMLEAEI